MFIGKFIWPANLKDVSALLLTLPSESDLPKLALMHTACGLFEFTMTAMT